MNQLGINPEMDKLARENKLGYWSCVSPKSNKFWVRKDGLDFYLPFFDDPKMTVWDRLQWFDERYPIGKDWQQPKQPTLVQKQFDIKLALEIANDRHSKSIIKTMSGFSVYTFCQTGKNRCLAKSETNIPGKINIIVTDLDGVSLSGNADNDLILFMWE